MTLEEETLTSQQQIHESDLASFTGMKVVVGIPCYNEEKSIAKIITQLRQISDRIIVCDDGSQDMTADIAQAMGCEVIRHKKNLGKGAALRSLFLAARREQFGAFVTIDGDGQHSTLDVARLTLPILKDECDIVIGSRFENESHFSDMPAYRKVGSQVINGLVRKASNISVKDTQSGLRAYSLNAVMHITPGEHGFAVDSEILCLASNEGMRIKEIPSKISYSGLDTSTSNPISQTMEVIGGTLKFSALRHPLVFYGVPSIIFFALSVVLGSWALYIFSSSGGLPFGPTIGAGATFIVSVVLGAVAIILYSLTTLVRERP